MHELSERLEDEIKTAMAGIAEFVDTEAFRATLAEMWSLPTVSRSLEKGSW